MRIPNVQPILAEIRASNRVVDAEGRSRDLDSAIDVHEGAMLESFVRDGGFSRTLEVGCAYGLSSLHICGALSEGGHHTIVDPFQRSQWGGIGLANLQRAGFDRYTLIEQPSELALPKLLSESQSFQLIFIDGWHTFDHTLLDAFYATRLLEVGGILMIDDGQMPAVRRVLRYLSNYPCYEVVGASALPRSATRRALDAVKLPLREITRRLPARWAAEVFDGSVLESDVGRGIYGGAVALRKVSPDERPWNWYAGF
jgi:predicted O-methyltransferase YrrM